MNQRISQLDKELALVNSRLDEIELRLQGVFPTRSLTEGVSPEVEFSSLSQSEHDEYERLESEKEQLIEQRRRLEDELYALTHSGR